jgi:hypothetical protein
VLKLSEIIKIKSECYQSTLLCAGMSISGTNILKLLSCGNCKSILNYTSQNKPLKINEAYWHLISNRSFGFSENPTIDLKKCDILELNLERNLCWELINDVSISLLLKRKQRSIIESNYTKHIYLYNSIATSSKSLNTQSLMSSKITSNIWKTETKFYTTTVPSFTLYSTFTTKEINNIKTTTALSDFNETTSTQIQTTSVPSFTLYSTFTTKEINNIKTTTALSHFNETTSTQIQTTSVPSFTLYSTFTTKEINNIKTTTALSNFNETTSTQIQTTSVPSFTLYSTFTTKEINNIKTTTALSDFNETTSTQMDTTILSITTLLSNNIQTTSALSTQTENQCYSFFNYTLNPLSNCSQLNNYCSYNQQVNIINKLNYLNLYKKLFDF